MANEIAKLFVTLGLEDKEFQANLKSVGKGVKLLGTQMAVMGAALTAGLGLSIKQFTDAGSEIYEMGLKTGFSAEALSGLKYAAEQSGASLDAVGMGIKGMANFLQNANLHTAAAGVALKQLGLRLSDLQGLNPEQTFQRLTGAIADIPDPLQRAALAQDVFGKSGMDLLPMLADGADGLQKMMDRARELGLVMDGETARKADALGDSLADVGKALDGLKQTIGDLLSGPLKPLVDTITNVIAGITQWVKNNPELAGTLLTIAAAVGALMVTVGPLLVALPLIVAGFHLMLGPIGAVMLVITALTALIVVVATNWEQLWISIKNVTASAINSMLVPLNLLITIINGVISLINLLPAVDIGKIPELRVAFGDINPNIGSQSHLSRLPGYAAGGIIPGPPGSPVPVMAHGGEVFAGVGRSFGGDTINVTVNGWVGSDQEIARKIREQFLQIKRQAYNTGI